MVVPLVSVLAQQPLLASVRPIILEQVSNGHQLDILAALAGVPDDYKEQILKLVVMAAEQQNIDVDADIWEEYYTLKTPSALQRLRELADEPSLIRFDLAGASVQINEDRSTLVQAGGTGHRTWESSLAITEYICKHPAEFSGLDEAIELGAGTGLVSLALAKLTPAKNVYATDGSELVVDKLPKTIAQNAVENILPMVLDWESPIGLEKLPKKATIFAGDILYGLTSSYVPILDLLEKLQPQKAYLCNPIRNAESYELFKKLCAERGYKVRVLETLAAKSRDETDYMFIVSIPPIPVELIELTL